MPTWPAATTAAAFQAEQGPLDLQVERCAERWEQLDALATAFITAALRDLGLFTRAGDHHRPDELVLSGHVAPAHEHLVTRWLGHLAADGLLERSDADTFTAVERSRIRSSPSAWPRPGGRSRAASPCSPTCVRCGTQLVPVVTGEESALATLFPDGSYETVDFLYSEWAVARYFNGIVRAAPVPGRRGRVRPLQVLELGAGTGGTTAAVLPGLPAERTGYTFTDVSDFFLTRAAERFAEFRSCTTSCSTSSGPRPSRASRRAHTTS